MTREGLMPKPSQVCSVADCDRKKRSRGLCDMHLQRFRHHGHTDLIREPHPFDTGALIGSPTKLTLQRFWAKIDVRSENECWPWTGSRHPKGGYGYFGLWGHTPLGAHRAAWMFHHGRP